MAVVKRNHPAAKAPPPPAGSTGASNSGSPPPQTPTTDSTTPSLDVLEAFWPGVVFRQRPDWTFESVSPEIESLTGLPISVWQHAPEHFWAVVHEADTESVAQQIRQCDKLPGPVTIQYRIRNQRNGRISHLTERRRAVRDAQGRVSAYEGLWLDLTRQTTAEQRLAKAAWKETLAVVSMGLAHDFNNILAGICSLSDTCLTQIDARHEFHESLTLINQNARQASQLIQRLVAVHRSKTGSRSYHDLNEITRDAVELVRRVVPRHIEFTHKLSPAPLPLYVDAVEYRQVIVNLALNAVEAMRERGQLQFKTSLCETAPPSAHAAGTPPRTPCCCFSIADTGSGIPARHLASVFDPFFTTKSRNKGSGLGLYQARLFVEQHQGLISVESKANAGTTFHLWLPQADFTEADQAEQLARQRRRSVLLVGAAGPALAEMTERLRRHFQVFAVTEGAEDWLESADFNLDGIILQAESGDANAQSLIRFVRTSHLPIKIIIQILEPTQNQMETQFLFNADLILTPDMTEPVALERIQHLFEAEGNPEP